MGFHTSLEGRGECGAKITAKILNKHLKDDKSLNFKIKEVSIDPEDPMKQVIIILQKTNLFNELDRNFELFKMIKKNFRTGVFEDLKSYGEIRKLWARNRNNEIYRLTFYD